MEFALNVEGQEALARLLEEMPDMLERKGVLKDALRAGAEIIKDDAVAYCPVYSGPARDDVIPGLARDSIKVRLSARKNSVTAKVETGEGDYKGDEFYASFLEFGHHVGKRPTGGKQRFRDADMRQWVEPHPFLRPAFDKNKDRAASAIAEAIRVALEGMAVQFPSDVNPL